MSDKQFEWNEAINKIFQMSREEREEYVAKITSGTTPADEIFEFVDEDVRSIENYVARELYKMFMQDDPEGFFRTRKQILKKQKVNYFKDYNHTRLLLFNRFSIERGKKGVYWTLRAETDELKARVCQAFGGQVEELKEYQGAEPVVAECRKDFASCTISAGGKSWKLDTELFLECVGKI